MAIRRWDFEISNDNVSLVMYPWKKLFKARILVNKIFYTCDDYKNISTVHQKSNLKVLPRLTIQKMCLSFGKQQRMCSINSRGASFGKKIFGASEKAEEWIFKISNDKVGLVIYPWKDHFKTRTLIKFWAVMIIEEYIGRARSKIFKSDYLLPISETHPNFGKRHRMSSINSKMTSFAWKNNFTRRWVEGHYRLQL